MSRHLIMNGVRDPRGFIDFWWRDLGARLSAGMARTQPHVPQSERWIARWLWVCLIVAITLYAAGGYEAGFTRLNAAAAHAPDGLWACLTVLGDERVVFALALLFALRYPRLFWALILAALIAAAYSRGFKALFDTTRPPGILPVEGFNLIGPGHRRAAFPSGHSVTAAVFFGTLLYFSTWNGLRALWLTLAVLVGLSRIAVGVHWPLDVAAGLFGGALAAWIGAHLAARWPGPATARPLHLAVVALGLILALTLPFDDGGYPDAALLLTLLSLLTVGVVAAGYLIGPMLRHRSGSRRSLEDAP